MCRPMIPTTKGPRLEPLKLHTCVPSVNCFMSCNMMSVGRFHAPIANCSCGTEPKDKVRGSIPCAILEFQRPKVIVVEPDFFSLDLFRPRSNELRSSERYHCDYGAPSGTAIEMFGKQLAPAARSYFNRALD